MALRFSRLDLDNGVIEIDLSRNWVGGKEKDTKTHQNRRIALDTETIVLLQEYKQRVREYVESLGIEFTDDLFLFAGTKAPDHRQPYPPDAVSSRYTDMAERLGIKTHLHALRHYSATELLTPESTSQPSRAVSDTAAEVPRPFGSTRPGWRPPTVRPPKSWVHECRSEGSVSWFTGQVARVQVA